MQLRKCERVSKPCRGDTFVDAIDNGEWIIDNEKCRNVETEYFKDRVEVFS